MASSSSTPLPWASQHVPLPHGVPSLADLALDSLAAAPENITLTIVNSTDVHLAVALLRRVISNGSLNFRTKTFLSNAGRNYSACLFMGVGDSKPGPVPCFQNPAVNLLPIANQLWLTVDTSS